MRKLTLLLTVLLLHALLCLSQTRTITGQVKDAKGEPIPFASIKVKGGKAGIAADATGNFSISVPPNAILIISATGYETVQQPAGTDATVSITLTAGRSDLTEVVVTALGVRRDKRELSSATQTISGDLVNRSGSGNALS